MVRINFSVEGLQARGADREEVLRALENDFPQAHFDPGTETFSVAIDPLAHSFADVRRAIGALGKRKGLVYLAVVMSP